MAADWRRYSVEILLQQGALLIGDGYRAKNCELASEGLPFARAGNINDGFHFDDADCIPLEHVAGCGAKVSQPGDVVFTSKGTVGRFAFVRQDTPRFVFSPQLSFWRVLDDALVDSRFLYYWMTSREFFLQYAGVKSQTDMAEYVSLQDQRRMHITLPSLPEQRAIAHILGGLDDKIELNRRMNATLEEMARALFHSWFVDFDPVRARAEGRQPTGMDAATAALFPDGFEETELGEVPQGWKVGTFDTVVDILSGGTPKTSVESYWNGDIPWFSVVDAPNPSDVFVLDTERHISQEGLDKCACVLLPKGTSIISARGTVGKVALVAEPMAMNQSCYGIRDASGLGDTFVYYLLRKSVAQLQQSSHGSVFDTITRRTFESHTVVIPLPEVAQAFEARVSRCLARILVSLRETQGLTAIRDALLPKLLSGEICLHTTGSAAATMV